MNYKSKILKSFFEELAPSYSVAYLEEKEPSRYGWQSPRAVFAFAGTT